MAKKVLSVTIEEKVLAEWKAFTEDNCINTSKLIEKLILDHLHKRRGGKT